MSLVLVALSAALMLAVGARLLGPATFTGLALTWTLSTVFGLGVATPTEQLINRRLNVSGGDDVRRLAGGLAGAVVVTGAVTTLALAGSAAQQRFLWLVPGAWVVYAGWALCALARGRLLGAGDLRAYGRSQVVEATSRVALVSAAMLAGGSTAAGLLAASVGVPLLLAGGWSALHRQTVAVRPVKAVGTRIVHEHVAFVLVALGYQICLSAPPLILEWKAGTSLPALTGAFVLASSVFRAPLVVSGGVLVAALARLSRTWAAEEHTGFTLQVRSTILHAVAIVTAATVAAACAAPIALPLLYGGRLGLPVVTYVALGLSTVVAVGVSGVTTALLAAGRGGHAAASWLAGALVMATLASILPVGSGVTGWALIGGPVVALACAGWALRATSGDPG